ncbi:MAG: RIP metalloprotease RseP [Rhodocyclaceae bacterium]|nr:RIP metalloprotease RseP [Rhodocyclaceae bacterium]
MSYAALLWYLGAFIVALGVLIVVHELGHYLVARLAGVKVLRFSVGFGKPIYRRCLGVDGTEWAIGAFPLGGYVKMLDEREGEVPAAELDRAFNRQPVGWRMLIVAAGPVANLLFAVLLYWVLFIHGVDELRPMLARPPAGSVAAAAGVEEGDLVRNVSGVAVRTAQELRWQLMQGLMERQPVVLEVMTSRNEIALRRLDTSFFDVAELDADFTTQLGVQPHHPRLRPVIGAVAPGSVAEVAGLLTGDEVRAINGRAIDEWSQLVTAVKASPGKSLAMTLARGSVTVEVALVPEETSERGVRIGRIGVGVRDDPAARAGLLVRVHLAPGEALARASIQTWETSLFSLRMIGRMLVGELSWKNISGPVTIADYAGQSARMGLDHYLKFLALISISLGVLNLLPVPILDGGHLLYYFIEVIKGGPLSERAMEIGQQVGLALLALLMAFAFYNDFNRLVSG